MITVRNYLRFGCAIGLVFIVLFAWGWIVDASALDPDVLMLQDPTEIPPASGGDAESEEIKTSASLTGTATAIAATATAFSVDATATAELFEAATASAATATAAYANTMATATARASATAAAVTVTPGAIAAEATATPGEVEEGGGDSGSPSGLRSLIERVTSLRAWVLGLLGGVLFVVLALPVLVLMRWRKKRRSARKLVEAEAMPELPRLVAADATGKPLVLPLNREGSAIGRGEDNAGIVTVDYPGYETVSQSHARVYYDKGRWKIQDLQSTNGVYVNGARTGHNVLQDGWQVRLGKVEFIFYVGSREAEA